MKRMIGPVVAAATLVVVATAGVASVNGSSAQSSGGRFARHQVKVFFTRKSSMDTTCRRVKAFDRTTRGSDVLHDAMSEQVNGPSRRERRSGVSSFFSRKTAGMVNSVAVANGVARVGLDDMRRVIPGASSSCGSASLMAELKATAKQFASVDRVVFSFEGSQNAFYSWLQTEAPR